MQRNLAPQRKSGAAWKSGPSGPRPKSVRSRGFSPGCLRAPAALWPANKTRYPEPIFPGTSL